MLLPLSGRQTATALQTWAGVPGAAGAWPQPLVGGGGLSGAENWFLENHDFYSLRCWRGVGWGWGCLRVTVRGKPPPLLLPATWALCGVRQVRQTNENCVELQVWAPVGTPGWEAAPAVPVNLLMSWRLIAPRTPQKSISPPFPPCCVCLWPPDIWQRWVSSYTPPSCRDLHRPVTLLMSPPRASGCSRLMAKRSRLLFPASLPLATPSAAWGPAVPETDR